MPAVCAVSGCGNKFQNTRGSTTKYYSFPKENQLRQKWLEACGKKRFASKATLYVCSKHFETSSFQNTSAQQQLLSHSPKHQRNLKGDAVPTKFLPINQNKVLSLSLQEETDSYEVVDVPSTSGSFSSPESKVTKLGKKRICVVLGCENSYLKTKGTGIRFYTFPKNEDLQRQWEEACLFKNDGTKIERAVVCSTHFKPSAFKRMFCRELMNYSTRQRDLEEDAVPTELLPKVSNKNKVQISSTMPISIKSSIGVSNKNSREPSSTSDIKPFINRDGSTQTTKIEPSKEHSGKILVQGPQAVAKSQITLALPTLECVQKLYTRSVAMEKENKLLLYENKKLVRKCARLEHQKNELYQKVKTLQTKNQEKADAEVESILKKMFKEGRVSAVVIEAKNPSASCQENN